mmetsp:Transcript_43042/g.99683  ORF Transcript_43042/g.99683 Transcript_43042/m.99683 type:complete len:233 (-) Transcript_43042:123-821(-)|eukprot:CAMPEP_0171126240 /NCGR_PEP_ID=MMETSP0766_2-20121228/112901_1 /TAXON_ID=439317 /ORGANISM="Gambierdiscus australes, Strain CAWD 149" /LENGTH=232 /DNA_ID=CAMNT_0011589267 /DNA_START=79 /DNA_END=777 /DNA_ORIENTATION=+
MANNADAAVEPADFQSGEKERLLQMRRRIRQQQERYTHLEDCRRAKELQLAEKWKQHWDKARAEEKEEVKNRLRELEKQNARAKQRQAEATEAEAARAQQQAVADEEAEAERRSAAVVSRGPRRRRRAREQLQQELGVPALVRAMMSGYHPPPKREDAEREAEERPSAHVGSAAEAEGEDPLKKERTAVFRNLARKQRLQMMSVVADQVLQCRHDMVGAFQHRFEVQPVSSV